MDCCSLVVAVRRLVLFFNGELEEDTPLDDRLILLVFFAVVIERIGTLVGVCSGNGFAQSKLMENPLLVIGNVVP